MHRLVLIAICLLLPLKALAAVVVPIAGLPGLAAEHAAAMAQTPAHDLAANPHCVFMAAEAKAAPDHSPATDHPCPHLAMATLGGHTSLALPADDPVAAPQFVPNEFVSVVLDVPLQPPLS